MKKRFLKESRWAYTCPKGVLLREVIRSCDNSVDDLTSVCAVIQLCCQDIQQHFGEEWDGYSDFETLIEDIDFLDVSGDTDDATESVDWALNEFYDLCDAYNIFIAI